MERQRRLEVLRPEELDKMVRDAIDAARGVRRPNPAQFALDACVAHCYEVGEVELAATILFVSAARVLGRTHQVLELVFQDVVDHRADPRVGAAADG